MKSLICILFFPTISTVLALNPPGSESLSDLTNIVHNLTQRIDKLEKENQLLRQQQTATSPRISFTVTVGDSDLKNLGTDQAIDFKNVVSQEGNSYDSRTGIFTCSVSGTYLFSASIMNNPPNTNTFVGYISKNGANSVPVHCSNSNGVYNMCSATLITRLVTGDKIWIKHTSGGETDNFSSFSGVLIHSG